MNKFGRFTVAGIGLVVLTQSAAFGQSGWFWQNPLPQGNDLAAIAAVDENTLVAVGKRGTIIRSIDRGDSWTVVFTVFYRSFNGVAFADGKMGIAVGESGTMVRSGDGGETWAPASSPTSATLYSVCFAGGTGMAAGSAGTILRTTDSGDSWVAVDSGTDLDLYGAHCLDESTATVVGERGTILRTQDAGITWTEQSSGTNGALGAVAFGSADRGWAVGGSLVLQTEDGGSHWTTRLTLQFFEHMYAVFAIGDRVIAVGSGGQRFSYNGFILLSSDGGGTWTRRTLPVPRCSPYGGLRGVALLDAQTGIAVGLGGVIERSTDAGSSWSTRLTCPISYTYSVSFVDEKRGWVAEHFAIHHTEDGGSTWIQQAPEGGRAVFFVDAEHGWVADVTGRTILRTTDGGANWEHHASGVDTFLYSFSFVDADNGWASGGFTAGESVILHTTDGGVTWTPQDSGTDRPINGVSFADAKRGIAVGGYSTILQTSDAGESWMSTRGGSPCDECDPYHPDGNCCHLRAVSFAEADTAIAVGSLRSLVSGPPIILRSTDGGSTWDWAEIDSSAERDMLNAVSFADAPNGLAVGTFSTVRTTDGGQTWHRQPSGFGGVSVSYVTCRTATVVAGTQSILRTVTGGE